MLGLVSGDKKTEDFLKSFDYIYKIRFQNLSFFERLKKINQSYEPLIQFCRNLQAGGKIASSFVAIAFLIYKHSKKTLQSNPI